jgi:hypothetical protein
MKTILHLGTICEWSASRFGLFTPVERALNTNLIGGCVEKIKIGGTQENHEKSHSG